MEIDGAASFDTSNMTIYNKTITKRRKKMLYKLNTDDNGDVKVKMKAGSCYVLTTKTKGEVVGIVEIAEKVEKASDNDFGICVDDGKFYIDGKIEAEDEPKKEDKWKK